MKIEYAFLLFVVGALYTGWWYLSRMHNIAQGNTDKFGNLK